MHDIEGLKPGELLRLVAQSRMMHVTPRRVGKSHSGAQAALLEAIMAEEQYDARHRPTPHNLIDVRAILNLNKED